MDKMNHISALIVDDQQDCIDMLQDELVQHCPDIDIVGTSQTILDAYKQITEKKPQLVFLDIDLGKQTSFELLELLKPVQFKVIFVTGHNDFAIKAIKYAALDYILKPFSGMDIVTAVELVKQTISSQVNFSLLQQHISGKTIIPKLAVSTGQTVELVDVSDITYAEADKNYTMLFTKDQKHVISKNIKELELLLEDQGFYRPHKSFLVNINHIKNFSTKEGGYITMPDKTQIPISQRKKQQFLEMMAKLYKH